MCVAEIHDRHHKEVLEARKHFFTDVRFSNDQKLIQNYNGLGWLFLA